MLQPRKPKIRDIINDSMNRKIEAHNGKSKESTTVVKDNTFVKTSKVGKLKPMTVEEKNKKAEANNQLALKTSKEQANKDWVQGSMEEVYKHPLMSPGYATPEGVAIGAIQSAIKLPGDLYDGDYKAAIVDALMVLPEVGNIAKGVKNVASKAYKINPLAEKLNNANKSYRIAGKDSYADFLESGVVRSKRTLPSNPTMEERMAARTTSFPSFQKGHADMRYMPKEGGVVYETSVPTFRRGDLNPVTNTPIKGRHYAHRPVDMETGKVITELPAKDVKVYSDKPHWLKGYKEINKETTSKLEFGGTLNTNNMIQPKRIKPVKKALAGAAIASIASTGIGMVTSIIEQAKARKEAEKAQALASANNFNTAMQEQDIYADKFKNDNINDLPVYDNGGKLNTNSSSTTGKYDTVGGDLVPISDNAEVVDGNTHKEKDIDNSYGVTLSEDGEPIANVEDKEVVVDNNLVFSDKLKKGNRTFASIALDVNSKIGELQSKNKGLVRPNEKFANERTIQGLEKLNENLFKEQEVVKANTYGTEDEMIDVVDGTVPVAENGMRLNKKNFLEDPVIDLKSNPSTDTSGIGVREGTFGSDLAPMLADNVANFFLAKNAPAPPKPIMRRAPVIDTRVNVNPQLANVASAVASSNETVRANTNSSNVARANITATNLKGAEAANSIYASKESAERQLQNEQVKALTANANANAELDSEYQNDVRDDRLQRSSALSKNITNLTEDIKAVRQNEIQKDSDDTLVTLGLLDDPTGEKARTFARLGRNMNTKNKMIALKEFERMRKFNENKNK